MLHLLEPFFGWVQRSPCYLLIRGPWSDICIHLYFGKKSNKHFGQNVKPVLTLSDGALSTDISLWPKLETWSFAR